MDREKIAKALAANILPDYHWNGLNQFVQAKYYEWRITPAGLTALRESGDG